MLSLGCAARVLLIALSVAGSAAREFCEKSDVADKDAYILQSSFGEESQVVHVLDDTRIRVCRKERGRLRWVVGLLGLACK